ncbi:TRAP transporter small permease subunit [Roseivivax marinus]|uniref:TRAP transporter small permease subunit n=1 Tax=Roseivivax marinus TaxID=1379903 RepID=UPI00273EAD47|nr:TRAP transporter small permease subunit [Roseivivax marinus]
MIAVIDRISRGLGVAVAWTILGVMALAVCDVLLRQLANAPIPWAFDISLQIFALHFMIAAPLALQADEHVRVTILRDRLPRRGRAVAELIGYLVLFFPFCISLIVYGQDFALRAWQYGERTSGAASIPVYYAKTLIPLMGVLLTLQGVAEAARLLSVLRKGGHA